MVLTLWRVTIMGGACVMLFCVVHAASVAHIMCGWDKHFPPLFPSPLNIL